MKYKSVNEQQIRFLDKIIKELENLKQTNDISSPTHDSDMRESAEKIIGEFYTEHLELEKEYLGGELWEVFSTIVRLARLLNSKISEQ